MKRQPFLHHHNLLRHRLRVLHHHNLLRHCLRVLHHHNLPHHRLQHLHHHNPLRHRLQVLHHHNPLRHRLRVLHHHNLLHHRLQVLHRRLQVRLGVLHHRLRVRLRVLRHHNLLCHRLQVLHHHNLRQVLPHKIARTRWALTVLSWHPDCVQISIRTIRTVAIAEQPAQPSLLACKESAPASTPKGSLVQVTSCLNFVQTLTMTIGIAGLAVSHARTGLDAWEDNARAVWISRTSSARLQLAVAQLLLLTSRTAEAVIGFVP
eukprot:jgi/Botrbrau1/11890/Bobra.0171s0002.1